MKHLALCEVLDALGDEIGAYVDPYAGMPFNRLMLPGYKFAQSEPSGRKGWADDIVYQVAGGKAPRLLASRYFQILSSPSAWGSFLVEGVLSADPVYPGSVGFAWLTCSQRRPLWICGDHAEDDRLTLKELLGPDAIVVDDLGAILRDDPDWLNRTVQQAHGTSLALVDPFDLGADDHSGRTARSVLRSAVQACDVVLAWYPYGSRYSKVRVQQIAEEAAVRGPVRQFEVTWMSVPPSRSVGAGLLTFGLPEERFSQLQSILYELQNLMMTT